MKKSNLFVFTLLFTLFAHAQHFNDYAKLWEKVERLELDNKSKSALEQVNIIYKKAKRNNNVPQQIKCFMYQSKFALILEEDAQLLIIDRLKETIAHSKKPTKNILNSILAELYAQYYNQYQWKFSYRTKTDEKVDNHDFRTWDLQTLYLEIDKLYQQSLADKDLLLKTDIKQYDAFIDVGSMSKYRPTLYAFLAHRALDFYKNSSIEILKTNASFHIDDEVYISDTDTFINHKIVTTDSLSKEYKALRIYQELLRFYTQNNYIDRLIYLEHERLMYVNNKSIIANVNDLFYSTLNYLTEKYKTYDEVAVLHYDIANYYYVRSEKWDRKKAFEYCANTILKYPNSQGASFCEALSNRILKKSLSLKFEQTIPKNQPSYSYVSYKNIDKLHLALYKVSDAQLEKLNHLPYNYNVDNDSLRIALIKTFELKKAWETTLPQVGDFREHSTEIVIPAQDYGTYLLLSHNESLDNPDNYKNIESNQLQFSNLTLLKTADKEQQVIQILDRITGAPVPNAAINFEIEHWKTKKTKIIHLGTNAGGFAYYELPEGYHVDSKTQVSTPNDQATFNGLSRDYVYKGKHRAHTEHNLFLFTDRAIYRPGQKVFFKAILSKTKELKSNVLANKEVEVTLYDANSQKVKSLKLVTNDFGSVTGEFTLPSDGLNGSFRIEARTKLKLIKDNAYASKYIQVEEYKRPKFEAEFKPITKTYRVNDTVKITGAATAFSGAKITDAKVVYRVKRTVNIPRWCYWYYDIATNNSSQEITHGETTTDDKGEFTIDFKALPDLETDKAYFPVFNYEVTADITDINGETHSASSTVRVGYHSMEAQAIIASPLDKTKDDNTLIVSTKNLNGTQVPAEGTVKIYKLQAPNTAYRPRPWKAPELPKLSESAFHQLFPDDPYSNELDSEKWKDGALVYSNSFKTTAEADTLKLNKILDWESGKYHIVVETKDRFDNPVKEESRFDVFAPNDTQIADNALFEIKKDQGSYKPYDTVNITFATASPEFWLNIWVEKKGSLSKQSYHLSNERKTISIPVTEEDRGGFSVHYYWVNKNTSKSGTLQIPVVYKPHELSITTKTFRDKLNPGQKEMWEFILKGTKKEAIAAEMLANMYDASLDELHSGNSYWMNALYRPTFYFRKSLDFNNSFSHGSQDFSFKEKTSRTKYLIASAINWYGFSFNGNYYTKREYKRALQDKYIRRGTGGDYAVSGTVSEDFGPLPGASVMIKGTTIGTITDFDGKYSILAKKGDILVFSFTGNSIEKTVNAHVIDAVLEYDDELQEVTILASPRYFKKERSYGNASRQYYSSVSMSVLKGKIAGVQVANNASADKVYLRGAVSALGKGEAIYIVDGKVVPADKVNMDDVATINTLKGAAATALYGMRGANGVIVITTKNGRGVKSSTPSPEELAVLAKIKARKNFNETAFFLPNLRTDKDGAIRFSFTMPEALTTWKLQLLAHSKDMKVGTKALSTITQKDLMVVPNTPRFLREGDSIIIQSKIVNLTEKAGHGFAQLSLEDAQTGKNIDQALANRQATQNFEVEAKGNTVVRWKLYIPKGTKTVQWKVVAKMGEFTDGEQNALPVLSNRMLVTESMAMWVKKGQTKTFTLDKLKAQQSATLRNHKLTLEITSNPAWYAVQALPYLIEYPHECAEQTFSRYYANALATHITNNNPKVKAVFEQWENSDALLSNLEKNEALKNIIIQETPWLRDAQSESAQKKRIGLLFNLNKMSRSLKRATNKLAHIQKSNGGFPWFKGGRYASRYITQHIASGYGHLNHLGVKTYSPKTTKMIDKAVAYLDGEIINDYQNILKDAAEIVKNADAKGKAQAKKDSAAYIAENHLGNYQMQYLYMRSFYKDKAQSESLKPAVDYYLKQSVEYWREYTSVYSRSLMALYLNRFEHQAVAKKLITALAENSITSDEMGMYWKTNKSGYYWYQAPIETQALAIEAFSEIDTDTTHVENLKLWLLKNKQTSQWKTTKATTEAIYALLLKGNNWLAVTENIAIKVGNQSIDPTKMPEVKVEAGSGYFKKSWAAEAIKSEMASVTLSKKENGVAWGALYWQYFEDLDKITAAETPLHLSKKVFLKKNTDRGEAMSLVDSTTALKVGDLLRIRIVLKADRTMEFIHMKDMRAAGLEPVNVISKYKWQDGLGYYESTKDASTNFFISRLPKGVYVFEYDLRVNNAGNFSNGITTIQSMYAPEFSSHSEGVRLQVTE